MDDRLLYIPIEKLREPKTKLRLPDTSDVQFYELCDSLKAVGFIDSICVREIAPDVYEIIDGFTRYLASKRIGLKELPCLVKYNVSDADVPLLQLQANAVGLQTKKAEFARQIRRMLEQRPDMQMSDISVLVKKSPTWIRSIIGLAKLPANLRLLVDRGEIGVENGLMLAKIPPQLQADYIDAARTLPSREFKPIAAAVVKQYTEAIKAGRMEAFWSAKFHPQPHLRSLKHVQAEVASRAHGPLLLATENCQTPLDGFYLALQWAMHMDNHSVEAQERAARAKTQPRHLRRRSHVNQ